jgi:hypothetical protein
VAPFLSAKRNSLLVQYDSATNARWMTDRKAPIRQNEETRPMLANLNRQKFYWIALVLFGLSLAAPAAFESKYGIAKACTDGHWDYGYALFAIGPFGLFLGQVGWYANLLMLVAVLKRRQDYAMGLVLFAILFIGFTSYSFTTMWNDVAGNPICKLGIGYYLWLLSAIALLVAIITSKPGIPAESS